MNEQSRTPNQPQRHNPLTVTLHWLIALIILIEALIGVGVLHFWPNTAVKVTPLTLHMVLGITLLVLMVIQIIVRFVGPRPKPAASGSAFLDFIAKATHGLLYVFTLLMGGTGILLAVQSHVLGLVVGRSVGLPMYFEPFLHAAVFVMFGLLVGLHVLGSLYHQFILRDRLFARMGYSIRSQSRKATPQVGPMGNPADNL